MNRLATSWPQHCGRQLRPRHWAILALLTLGGCTHLPVQDSATQPATTSPPVAASSAGATCSGTTTLPAEYRGLLQPVQDETLLTKALGAPDKGGLCQGQVYQATATVTLFRAWNSTNPYSRLGKWWAFHKPTGEVAQYRNNYEICYQFSPLDKLTRCTLKPGAKVVIGTGQSVWCSEYLSYPTNAAYQIYVDDASPAMLGCTDFDGMFNWQPVVEVVP